ncbi:MAG: GNAT family N-acetyltransferase, partial [Candidatus Brocadiae bacterium]|nr:GNAT family N-acetyltransferase [Candidatus Brocadiia bacterium]
MGVPGHGGARRHDAGRQGRAREFPPRGGTGRHPRGADPSRGDEIRDPDAPGTALGRAQVTGVRIGAARKSDARAFLDLVTALAHFEKLPPPDAAARRRLVRDAFGPARRYTLWVAREAGRVVAYAIFFFTYSSFLARPTLYLEDIFVHPDARGRGIATAVMRALAAEARRRGCGRFEWMVLDWNRP